MTTATINHWVQAVHNCAVERGWWEPGKSKTPLEAHMLIVTEISEATEEVRNNRPPIYQMDGDKIVTFDELFYDRTKKPEGEAVELADAVIRIMDYFGKQGWDLEEVVKLKHEYNVTRPYRHGGKSA